MPELHELSVAEAAAQIREGTLSPVALAESLLTRIDALDGDLQAWVTIDRDAVLSAAREREAEVQRGDPLGLIHGVPVGLKDIFYTEGMLTACGSKVNADFVPEFDATSVAKIKAAGGIILGKAVTTEFASGDPSPTCNPWNLEHTPGGSSSGSSAAVAARMVPAALGSQTGGSTCRPAAYNGIVGVKATYGRISRYGVAPLSWSLDHVGILTRTVADGALMLTVLSGADDNDPGSLREPVPDFSAQMAEHDRPRASGWCGSTTRTMPRRRCGRTLRPWPTNWRKLELKSRKYPCLTASPWCTASSVSCRTSSARESTRSITAFAPPTTARASAPAWRWA